MDPRHKPGAATVPGVIVIGSTIVVGLDGSDDCSSGLRWAIELAKHSGAEVLAVHAVYQPVPASWSEDARDELLATVIAQAEETLQGWIAPLRETTVEHRSLVVAGMPEVALLEVAEAEDAGMIVVGRRGLGTIARFMLGSVSYHLIQMAPIPVVVMPTKE